MNMLDGSTLSIDSLHPVQGCTLSHWSQGIGFLNGRYRCLLHTYHVRILKEFYLVVQVCVSGKPADVLTEKHIVGIALARTYYWRSW